jgi:hypothetical protein
MAENLSRPLFGFPISPLFCLAQRDIKCALGIHDLKYLIAPNAEKGLKKCTVLISTRRQSRRCIASRQQVRRNRFSFASRFSVSLSSYLPSLRVEPRHLRALPSCIFRKCQSKIAQVSSRPRCRCHCLSLHILHSTHLRVSQSVRTRLPPSRPTFNRQPIHRSSSGPTPGTRMASPKGHR